MFIVNLIKTIEAGIKASYADHSVLLEQCFHSPDKCPQELCIDRRAGIEENLRIGHRNSTKLIRQHAVAHHLARKPVKIQLQTGFQHGRETGNRLCESRVIDSAMTAVAVFSGFGTFGFCFPVLFFGFGRNGRKIWLHCGKDDLVEFLGAAPFRSGDQGRIHGQLKTIVPEEPIHHRIAGALPGRPVPVFPAGRM